jgi:hypothetical protein
LRPDHRPTEPPKLERETTDDIAQPHASSLSPEYLELKNLWDEAYDLLRKKNAKLIDAYEKDLLASQDTEKQDAPTQTSSDRQAQIQKLAERKLQDIQNAQLKLTLGGREVVVKEQIRKVVNMIISAKDLIGLAVSADPHAALAWAGVLVVLPVSTYTVGHYH